MFKRTGKKQRFTIATIFKTIPTVAEYTLLPTEVKNFVDDIITTGIKANPVARVKGKNISPVQADFWQLSYEQIILLRNAVESMQMEEVFKLIYGLPEKQFLKLQVFNCFACYKWITGQLLEMARIEQDHLGGEPSLDEKNAGVEELAQFGYANNLDMLAGGDLLKYDDILLKPYAVVFRKLYMEKVKQDIQKRYMDYVSRKAKRNS